METRIYKANAICVSAWDTTQAKVEVEVMDGIGIHIVGLPDDESKETLLRVVTVMQGRGLRIPGRKIVITVMHNHTHCVKWWLFDLPIYMALAAACGDDKINPMAWYAGKLNIDGTIEKTDPMDAKALRGIVWDGFIICPMESFPTNVMINNVDALL